jgi:hypothetical protein
VFALKRKITVDYYNFVVVSIPCTKEYNVNIQLEIFIRAETKDRQDCPFQETQLKLPDLPVDIAVNLLSFLSLNTEPVL